MYKVLERIILDRLIKHNEETTRDEQAGFRPMEYQETPSGHPLTDLEYADDAVIFAVSSTKLQHVVNLVSKLAPAFGLRLPPDRCKQMWISSTPPQGIRVDGQPIELVDEFCYLGCTLKNNGSYERDVQQRCTKATSAFNSLAKCLWWTVITNEVKLRVYLSTIRPIMMYGLETWIAPASVMEMPDCTERKLLRLLLGYFWPRVYHNEYLYAEVDVVYRRMTRGRYQYFAPPSKVAKVNRLRFLGHILRRPSDRLVQCVLRSLLGLSWKKPPGRKRKFWTEVVKEDLRTLGVGRQYRRDVKFHRIWNSDEWIDSVQAHAEDREDTHWPGPILFSSEPPLFDTNRSVVLLTPTTDSSDFERSLPNIPVKKLPKNCSGDVKEQSLKDGSTTSPKVEDVCKQKMVISKDTALKEKTPSQSAERMPVNVAEKYRSIFDEGDDDDDDLFDIKAKQELPKLVDKEKTEKVMPKKLIESPFSKLLGEKLARGPIQPAESKQADTSSSKATVTGIVATVASPKAKKDSDETHSSDFFKPLYSVVKDRTRGPTRRPPSKNKVGSGILPPEIGDAHNSPAEDVVSKLEKAEVVVAENEKLPTESKENPHASIKQEMTTHAECAQRSAVQSLFDADSDEGEDGDNLFSNAVAQNLKCSASSDVEHVSSSKPSSKVTTHSLFSDDDDSDLSLFRKK
ncbi:hypothetical protein RB195_025522 [Necator americanus]|uniref:Reverse transcriptase domain-containing protein n=1 Tax=Necator americanus TaxID=51031 RepID=A0ABR1ESN1_NECAM